MIDKLLCTLQVVCIFCVCAGRGGAATVCLVLCPALLEVGLFLPEVPFQGVVESCLGVFTVSKAAGGIVQRIRHLPCKPANPSSITGLPLGPTSPLQESFLSIAECGSRSPTKPQSQNPKRLSLSNLNGSFSERPNLKDSYINILANFVALVFVTG